MITPSVQLTDPTSQQTEVGPGGLQKRPTPVTPAQTALFNQTKEMFDSSAQDRRAVEQMVFESWAFYLGNHGAYWDANSRKLNQRKSRSPHTIVERRNKIKSKIKKNIATGLRNDPDLTFAPWTGSQTDRAAAMISRGIEDHYTETHRDKRRTWEAARWAFTTSTCREKYWWNPNGWAEVPTGFDDDGNPTGSKIEQVGNICVGLVPWHEYYGDPRATDEQEQRWCIHAKQISLGEWQENYEDGWMVEGGPPSDMRAATESMAASVLGGYPRGSQPGQSSSSQTMYEVWEKPSKEYPEKWIADANDSAGGYWQGGRWWTCSGDGRVVTEPAPLPRWLRRADGTWDLPFNDLSFEKGQGTLHGLNAVWDLVGAQRGYNHAVSRMAEWLKTMYGKILACEGSQITSTAFDSAKDGEIVYWSPNAGGEPKPWLPSPMPTFFLEHLQQCETDMQDMAGVHEVSKGETPPQVTAASAIRLLQDSDTTQLADFTTNLEGFIQRRADMRHRIARAYFKEPRLLFLSPTKGSKTNAAPKPPDALVTPGVPVAPNQGAPIGPAIGGSVGGTGIPQGMGAPGQGPQNGLPSVAPPTDDTGLPSPIMQAVTFESFAQGSVRVRVTPGSATPKSPEAEVEIVLELLKTGLFGPPGDPTAAKIVLQELEIMDPNAVYEDMLQARADAAAIAAANQPNPEQIALQQAHVQAESMQIMEAVKLHSQLVLIEAKAKAAGETEAIKLHALAQLRALEAHLDTMSPPARSIAAKLTLGSVSGPDAESKLFGLKPDAAAEVKSVQAPKPSTSINPPKKGNSNA